ncbi:MAG: hypothetical protein ACLFVC_01405, partial [Opitutales bacterium]
SRPRLYLGLLHLKRFGHWSRNWIVTPATEITIEGYPRCGNSFARSAFMQAQKRDYVIATHVHSYAQVVRSVELGIPTMVPVREPREACLSLVALTYEIENAELSEANLRRAKRSLLRNFLNYQKFYRQVARLKDDVIIADFPVITSDYATVIHRVNRRFGTDFELYRNCPENDKEVFDNSDFHLSPNPQRNTIKARLSACMEEAEVRVLADEADGIYAHIRSIEREQAERYGNAPAA